MSGVRKKGKMDGRKELKKGIIKVVAKKNRYTMRKRRRHGVKNKVGNAKRRKEDKK